ncbi:lycopene cyclase family protein [Streptomonospora nanhaiensis]|uniref:lycopene cyclase family protein n=1 Tax=Streptomonospora nanhaiensis TaxID=1323731 RepID=UPI001C38247B|nr:lycopene cyclase family protein [Streptomonospora nanhaiensis]MBV2365288.1 lycopene cyclase [Streptomonospora nanhaiensis]
MRQFDVAVVGAGAAGLSLTHRLAASNRAAGRRLGIALVEPPPGPARPPERTWCYWERGVGRWDPVLAARWERLAVVGADGRRRVHRTAPFSYKMLRSRDFEKYVAATAVEGVTVLRATVAEVADGAERAVVRAVDGAGAPVEIAATWVFDSRPAAPPPGRTALLQHFRGWFARTPHDAFDPSGAVLMDLRTPQPARGVSFGYVLPLSPREALVEYTEFTREALDTPAYEAALRDYTGRVLKLREVEVTAAEQGAIPMTDARLPTRAGRRVFRIGAAGGATRPSTGYTFSGIQRQTAAVARALERGAEPVPPTPHRRRHLAMDAVLLRALDTGRVDGAAFFTRLFDRTPLPAVLDFLDGPSHPLRELAIGLRAPVAPMALTAAECALRRRPRVRPRG